MLDNLKELAQKNKEAFNELQEQWIEDYHKAMKEKNKAERVGDLNGRDLYHGDWKE